MVEDPAAEVARLIVAAVEAGGHVVLTGGSTPARAYEMAAGADANWDAATVWFGDERCVPPDHPDSNYRMAESSLLGRLDPRPEVMRIEGELGPEAASGAYEAEVRSRLGDVPRWDLLLLGLGPDGHVASLFPGKPEVQERDRLVVGVPIAGLEPQVPRVSLTLPALNAARAVVFLVTGQQKADAVVRAFGPSPDDRVPGAHVRPADGSLTVVLDEAAASRLPS